MRYRPATMVASVLVVVTAFAAVAQAVPSRWAGGRPPECSRIVGRGANAWERAKSPDLRHYCDLVASAASKLAGTTATAQLALVAAREAERTRPGYAAPRVLEGRALAALGDIGAALQALTEARSRDPRSLDDPQALFAWAQVLARTGHRDDAAEAYRALLPRASTLSGVDRSIAEVEAGLVAMGRGQSGLDEAVAALREAVREGRDETRSTAILVLALALDRSGKVDQARALFEERASNADPRKVVDSGRAKELLEVAPEETHALSALALEGSDPASARDEWQMVLAPGARGPWVAYARAHIEALARVRTEPGSAR